MSSTGEVACLGDDFEEAFLKSMMAVGLKWPIKKILITTGAPESKTDFLSSARMLAHLGVEIFATPGTAQFLNDQNIVCEKVTLPNENKSDSAEALIRRGGVDLVINIPRVDHRDELTQGYLIRRAAADCGIPLITNLPLAKRLVESIVLKTRDDLLIKAWGEYEVG
jgi:carbamoyl-phosphate synthase large subunit